MTHLAFQVPRQRAPPGEYLVTAIEDVEQGEWFDPAFLDGIKGRATKIRIDEGEERTQDLKVSPM